MEIKFVNELADLTRPYCILIIITVLKKAAVVKKKKNCDYKLGLLKEHKLDKQVPYESTSSRQLIDTRTQNRQINTI